MFRFGLILMMVALSSGCTFKKFADAGSEQVKAYTEETEKSLKCTYVTSHTIREHVNNTVTVSKNLAVQEGATHIRITNSDNTVTDTHKASRFSTVVVDMYRCH